MPAIVRDLVANHGHNIGHRRLVKDEVWCRMQFRDEADLRAFAGLLRWTAFRFDEPQQPSEPAPTVAPAAGTAPVARRK